MLLYLWIEALNSKVGISIQTDNRTILRQHLYRARAEAKDPKLDSITMILPEKEDEIWLVHKDADSNGADNEGHNELIY
jgi:hypothetical protein